MHPQIFQQLHADSTSIQRVRPKVQLKSIVACRSRTSPNVSSCFQEENLMTSLAEPGRRHQSGQTASDNHGFDIARMFISIDVSPQFTGLD